MKKLKKVLQGLGIIIVLIFLFRGWLFRTSVSYSKVGQRNQIRLEDKDLLSELKIEKKNRALSIQEIISIARNKTNKKLYFSTGKNSRNPNEILKVGTANCIGYSALFNAIMNHLIKDQKLKNKYKANHLVGKINFIGIDVHRFFDSPLLKDHDYNEVIDLETGERFYIDPTISDYLNIHHL